ncbi:MAG: prenyltransferase [Dehalococcoidia bacterium]|nr:prenyltransferase [Dehalococcoidia bacterium]
MSREKTGYQKITPKAIYLLAAPHSWAPASIIPVLFASVLALGTGAFSVPMFYVLLIAAVLMHSAVNSLNDYYDFIHGTDTLENSPERDDAVLVYNSFEPRTVRLVGVCYLLTALALGAYVVCVTNYVPLVIGFIGTVTVLAYSAGPQPLSYMPLGEFASGVVMGILLPFAVFAALTGDMYWHMFYLCLPLMLGICLIMLTNNTCDIERDGTVGRKTLPMLLGRSKARIMHRVFMLSWIGAVIVLSITNFRDGWFILPLGLVAGWQSVKSLIAARLTPAHRGQHMRDIFTTNLLINGTYVLCAMVAGFLRSAHY